MDSIRKLPESFEAALAPLWAAYPPDAALERLVVREGTARTAAAALLETLVSQEPIARHPALAAGLWLYVDELDRSHALSQDLHDATGSAWHGIMHRREGDFSNSHYWFRKAGRHPALAAIPGYEPHAYIDAVAAAGPGNPAELVALQRLEWAALFAWCAARAADSE
jgi:hypothetical protein